MNGNSGELPKLHLPGDEKFTSYKNTLQGYCQKMKLSVPTYQAEKESNGLRGVVTFDSNYIRCQEISGSVKEADSHAAYDALRQLGYMKNQKFEMLSNQLKRKDGKGNTGSNAKQMKPGEKIPITSKGQLNQYAQKEKLLLPTYESSVVENGGFSCTVTINNKKFKSLGTCKKSKDAEQNAAQVALHSLVGGPLPKVESVDTSDGLVAAPFKNRLQEYCQRLGKSLPTYNAEFLKDTKTYQAVVSVNGAEYRGAAVKGKKNAEGAAAEIALKAMGLLA